MGYTNFCYRVLLFDLPRYREAVDDLKRVVPETGIDLAGPDGRGSPILNYADVRFNGRAPQGVEPLELPRSYMGWVRRGKLPGFTHSKTYRLPYDLAVKAALLVFKHRFGPEVEITSNDEDLVAAWGPAIELAHRVLGYPKAWNVEEETLKEGLHRHLVPVEPC